MNDQPLDIASFLKLVLEALHASRIEYVIGGAVAERARDLDVEPLKCFPDT